MPSLILTLPASLPSAAPPCAAVWTGDGTTVLRQTEAPLPLIQPGDDADTVVVVPIAQLSWHRVDLPRGTLARARSGDGARLRAVLHGLLEDHLLDDMDGLHLALQPQAQEGAPLWVAVCQRAWLKAWLDALEHAGHRVSRIVPEVAPAPEAAASSLWLQGPAEAPTLLAATPQGILQLPLHAHGLLAALPTDAPVMATPAVADAAERSFAGRVRLQTGAQAALLAAQGPWDLAQFDLVRTRTTRLRKQLGQAAQNLLHAPQWRPARWALVALLATHLVGIQAWAWKEQSALAAKREAIRTALTQTFPDVRLVVDAPVQMARALADLQRQNGAAAQSDLETMLGHFQALAPEFSAPTAIEFVANELRLLGTGVTPETLAGLDGRLRGAGYRARLDGEHLVLRAEALR